MTIATYSDLKTAVASWLHRSDLTSNIPDFIALAEARMSAYVKSRSMETRTSLTATSGNAYVTLPTDVVDVRRLMLSATNPQVPLKYVTPDEITKDYPYSTTGVPSVFSVIGGALQLAPIPDSAYAIELTYLQRIPALSDTNTTNWLLTAYPNAYLYGTLVQAMPFIRDDARAQTFQTLFKDAIDSINTVDWYSGSTMTVRAS